MGTLGLIALVGVGTGWAVGLVCQAQGAELAERQAGRWRAWFGVLALSATLGLVATALILNAGRDEEPSRVQFTDQP